MKCCPRPVPLPVPSGCGATKVPTENSHSAPAARFSFSPFHVASKIDIAHRRRRPTCREGVVLCCVLSRSLLPHTRLRSSSSSPPNDFWDGIYWRRVTTSSVVANCFWALSLSPKSIAPRFLEISALAQPVIRAELTPTGESILEKKKRRESSAMCCTGRHPTPPIRPFESYDLFKRAKKKELERRKSVHFLFIHPRASALIPLPFWAGPTAVPFSTFAYYHIECGWLADSAFIFRP